MKISVCIPTCRRPALLKECLDSILKQDPPHEILIGDDSPEDDTKHLVKEYERGLPENSVRYFRNVPPLGQARNVDALFKEATGDLVALIHDDDLFCEGAFRTLRPCFENPRVAVAYGKQLIASEAGRIDQVHSNALNQTFYRTAGSAGVQDDFLEAALLQQFPNDGFLIRVHIAKAVGYIEAGKLMGDACDYGFAILCAQAFPKMKPCFVDQFTAIYRESGQSVARCNLRYDAGYRGYKYAASLSDAVTGKTRVSQWLKERAPVAIGQALNLGLTKEALGIYFSKWHRSKIFTPGGIKRGLFLAGGLLAKPFTRVS